MFDSPILEVGIGMVLVYFVLGLISSGATDIIRYIVGLRARILRKGLQELLDGSIMGLYEKVGNRIHGGNSKSGNRTYVASRSLALALIAEAQEQAGGAKKTIDDLATDVDKLAQQAGNPRLATLAVGIRSVGTQGEKVVQAVQDWFDDAFQAMADLRKRYSQWIVIGVSAVVVAVLNADTIAIGRSLWLDNELRDRVMELAEKTEKVEPLFEVQTLPPDTTVADTAREQAVVLTESGKELAAEFLGLQLPLGWSKATLPTTFYGWLLKVIGLLGTALAVSLGAPFWYDILRKLLGVRKVLGRKEEDGTN